MMGIRRFDDLIAEGKARFDGDRKPYEQLKSILKNFDPLFELMPGTGGPRPAQASGKDPFEQPQPASSAGE
jgi:hypothetical protein